VTDRQTDGQTPDDGMGHAYAQLGAAKRIERFGKWYVMKTIGKEHWSASVTVTVTNVGQ